MNIEDLISQYVDGDLPSEAEAEMHHRLAVSPEARRLFRAQIALRGIARNTKVLHTPAPELRAKLFERLQREEGMATAVPAVASEPVTGGADALPVASPVADGRGRRRRRAIAWLMPTVVASIIAVAILWKPGEPMPQRPDPTLADNAVGTGTVAPGRGEAPVSEDIPAAAPAASPLSTQSAPPASGSGASRFSAPEQGYRGDVAARRSYTTSAPSPEMAAAPMTERDVSDKDQLMASADVDRSEVPMGLGESVQSTSPMTTQSARMTKSTPSLKSGPDHAKGKFDGPEPRLMGGGSNNGGRNATEGGIGADGGNGGRSKLMAILPPPPPSGTEPVTTMGGGSGYNVDSSVGSTRRELAETTPVLASSRSGDDAAPNTTLELREPRYVVTLHQGSFAGAKGNPVAMDFGIRGGMQLADGRHLVFVTAGVSSYRRSVSDSITRVIISGVTSSPAISPTGSREGSYEFFGGVGYRYTHRFSQSWGLGAGVTGTVGSHYLRAGFETPVSYRPNGWLRLEVVPTVRYSRVHGGSSSTVEHRVLPGGEEQELQRTITPDGDATVDVGVGIGASVVW